MSELVLLHHNEPMTTSLAIASGVDLQHKNVLELIYKYADSLAEFGKVEFEILPAGAEARFGIGNSAFEMAAKAENIQLETRNSRSSRGRPTEVAFLNEPQSTLLITFMRNSDIVRRFKIALVKAFFEMRDRLRSVQPQFLTGNLSHGADLVVAADRTFRGFMRVARAAGLGLPMALRVANQQTLARTGMDMLAELDVDPDAINPAPARRPLNRLEQALSDWLAAAGPGPWRMKQILHEAIGMPPEHPDNARAVLAAASYLRSLGMTMRMARIRGGKTGRYWYRAGALESMWDAVAVNPEKEA